MPKGCGVRKGEKRKKSIKEEREESVLENCFKEMDLSTIGLRDEERNAACWITSAETTDGYLTILEKQLKTHGRPIGLYVNKHNAFRVNRKEVKQEECETHFGRVLRELDIELVCAHSPQAKGRVERANGTLQDRFVKEMRLRGISSIEEVNAFLPEFIEDYNKRFGKSPKEPEGAHRPLRAQDNLEAILFF